VFACQPFILTSTGDLLYDFAGRVEEKKYLLLVTAVQLLTAVLAMYLIT